jgi:phage portal protein BeeE
VTIVPGRAGWPEAYEYTVDGRSVRIVRGADGWMPAMQLKLFHPTDDYYGLSPLEAAAFAIDVHNASGAWNKALLDNAARPSGALVYGGKDGERLTAEQFALLKEELSGHAGTINAGRPLLLEGGLDWKASALRRNSSLRISKICSAAHLRGRSCPPMLLRSGRAIQADAR